MGLLTAKNREQAASLLPWGGRGWGGLQEELLVAGSLTIAAPAVSLIVQGIILVVLTNLHSQLDFFFFLILL